MIITVKIHNTDATEIRRLTLDTGSSDFASLVEQVKKLFGLPNIFPLLLQYKDEFGDTMKLTSDVELKEALNLAVNKFNSTLHLYMGVDVSKKLSSSSMGTSSLSTSSFVQSSMNISSSSLPIRPPQDVSKLFGAIGNITSAIPKEQFNEMTNNLHNNPITHQILNQLIVGLSALSLPTAKKNNTVHSCRCSICARQIIGVRYKCSICDDFDMCEDCESKDGSHDESHNLLKMKQPSIKFQAPPSPLQFSSPSVTFGAALVQDVTLPDGCVVAPNEMFVKTWRIKNTGNALWPVGTSLSFLTGDSMGNPTNVAVASVGPNFTVDVSVSCIAPKHTGQFISYWRLVTPQGVQFGDKIWISVKVEKSYDAVVEEKKRMEEMEKQRKMDEIKRKRDADEQALLDKIRQEKLLAEKAAFEKERAERERVDREAKARADRETRERADRETRERADREAKERAEHERRVQLEREEKEKKEREAKEREAKEREAIEREAKEREAKEQAEHERRVQLERERAVRELKEREEKERKEREERERIEREDREKRERLNASNNGENGKLLAGLKQLEEMGFSDRDRNTQLLRKHKYDVMATIQELL